MRSFLRFCFNASLGIWLGATLFFLFALLRLFAVMPVEAGRVAGPLFPVYYTTGAVCAGVALASAVLLALVGRGGSAAGKLMPVVLVLALAGVNYYGGWVVLPEATAARVEVQTKKGTPGAVRAQREFQRLHRLSTRLFSAELILLAVALVYGGAALRE